MRAREREREANRAKRNVEGTFDDGPIAFTDASTILRSFVADRQGETEGRKSREESDFVGDESKKKSGDRSPVRRLLS